MLATSFVLALCVYLNSNSMCVAQIILGIAIGGDVFPGSTLSDHVLRFNNIPQVCNAIYY